MTTPTPTPEALRHRAAARRWARSGEWGFTIASSAVNVTVVAAAGGSLLRILLAGLAPIVLAKMAHLLAKVLQSGIMVSGVHWGVNLVVAGAVALIGAGAFALSFDMLRRAAEPDHGQLAWVFPATLDLAIVVCAAVLAVIAWADEQDQRNGVPPRVTVWNRLTDRITGDRDMASAQLVTEPGHEQVVQDAPPAGPLMEDHPAEPMNRFADQPVAQTPAAVVQPEPQVVPPAVNQVVDHTVNRDNSVTEPLAVEAVDQAQEPVSHHPTAEVDRDQELVNRRPLALVDQPVNRGVDHRVIAEQVVARTASDWSVDQLERVSRSTPGVGQRVLAEQLGVSPSTVNRMRKAIAEVAAGTNPEEPEPEPALA